MQYRNKQDNSKTTATVALVEIGGSHEECLYSQIAFLQESGYVPLLIVTPDILERMDIPSGVHVYILQHNKGFWGRWKQALEIRKTISQKQCRAVVFNTAQGHTVANFCRLPLPKHLTVAGVLHTTRVLRKSHTQRTISRTIKKYFFLNDYLAKQAEQLNPDCQFRALYPIYDPVLVGKKSTFSDNNLLRICIPGIVEPKRRDYEFLLNLLIKHPDLPIYLDIPGNDGAEAETLHPLLQHPAIQHKISRRNYFITKTELWESVLAADVLMPLIHPTTPDFGELHNEKISGMYTLSLQSGVPLLLHEDLRNTHSADIAGLFYSLDECAKHLRALASDKQPLHTVNRQILLSEHLRPDVMRHHYCRFLELEE